VWCFSFVCLRSVHPILPVSLDCPFLIALSVLCNVYLYKYDFDFVSEDDILFDGMTIYVLCVPFKIIDKQHNNAMRILQSLRCYTGKVASPVDFICWDIHCKKKSGTLH
jgi:hypothetical protein